MTVLWLLITFLGISLAYSGSPEENVGDPSLFEGDVKLLPDQKFAIENGLDLGPVDSFGASRSRRWTNGVVPYTIAQSLSSPSARRVIESAMKEWSAKTCIRFVKRTSQRSYIEFFNRFGCWSFVGMTGVKQKISLGQPCWHHGIVVHEIGHALGFWHEQSRPDRDDYITIMWDNINSGNRHNFNKYSNSQIDSLNVPYDYGSVMHYGKRAFSINGRDTIVSKNPGVTFGQRKGLSASDTKQMNLMYKCQQGTPQPAIPPKPETPSPPRPTPPKPQTTSPPRPTPPSARVNIDIRSEGCDDPKLVNVRCGRAYIKVNGREYSRKKRGHNVVLVDYKTGRVEQSLSFDTHGSYTQTINMKNLLLRWATTLPGKVVLIAVQDEGYSRLYRTVQDALVRVGAKKPFTYRYRGSYALVGYTGPDKPSWIKQVQNVRRRGPSVIKMSLNINPATDGPVPPTGKPLPTTNGPVPPTGKPLPTTSSCGVSGASARVIGGINAAPGAWPWQIALLSSSSQRFSCGGSLIYADWIVTAAHCIKSRVGSSYTVLLGAHNRNSPESHEQRIKGKRVIVHPQYGRLNNDIALVQLERPATMSSRVSTVCLPSHNYALPLSSTCYITGWGKIKHPGSSHHTLQQAKLAPVSKQECQRKLSSPPSGNAMSITDQMLCAGQKDTNLSGCHGDSGGPYVCLDGSNRFVLHGVVSWGSPRCAAHERYTVFARVARFRNWIDQEIKKALG